MPPRAKRNAFSIAGLSTCETATRGLLKIHTRTAHGRPGEWRQPTTCCLEKPPRSPIRSNVKPHTSSNDDRSGRRNNTDTARNRQGQQPTSPQSNSSAQQLERLRHSVHKRGRTCTSSGRRSGQRDGRLDDRDGERSGWHRLCRTHPHTARDIIRSRKRMNKKRGLRKECEELWNAILHEKTLNRKTWGTRSETTMTPCVPSGTSALSRGMFLHPKTREGRRQPSDASGMMQKRWTAPCPCTMRVIQRAPWYAAREPAPGAYSNS